MKDQQHLDQQTTAELYKLSQLIKQSINTAYFYYSTCQIRKKAIFNMMEIKKQCLLYCIQTPQETILSYSEYQNKDSLAKSIEQTVKSYNIKELNIMPQTQKDELTLEKIDQQKNSMRLTFKFGSEKLAMIWKQKIKKLQESGLKVRQSKTYNWLHLLNLNLMVRPQIPHIEENKVDQNQPNSAQLKEITSLIMFNRSNMKVLAEQLVKRQNNRVQATISLVNQWRVKCNLMQDKFTYLSNKNEQMVQKQKKYQEEITKQNSQINLHKSRLDQMTSQYQNQVEKYNKVKQFLQTSQIRKQQLQTNIEAQQKKIQQQISQIADLTTKIEEMVSTQHQQHQTITEMTKQKQILIEQNQQLTKQKQALIVQKQVLSSQKRKIQSDYQKALVSIQNLKNNQEDKILQLQRYNTDLSNRLQHQQISHLFDGDILDPEFYDQKSYLSSQIQKYHKREIMSTKKIYQLDYKNKTSFHQYIDEVDNICVLIKLKNGNIVAGFSVSPLSSTRMANQGGLIISVTNKKTYNLMAGKRSVTYDQFFLIFGNSELRLKHAENKFFTNFGISNSFFASNGDRHTVLTGEGTEKQVQLDTFQVFQIKFRQKE